MRTYGPVVFVFGIVCAIAAVLVVIVPRRDDATPTRPDATVPSIPVPQPRVEAAPEPAPTMPTPVEPRPKIHRAAREGFVEELAANMARDGMPFNFALGDPDTTLVVVGDGCTATFVAVVIKVAGRNMRNVGFERVVCATGIGAKDL